MHPWLPKHFIAIVGSFLLLAACAGAGPVLKLSAEANRETTRCMTEFVAMDRAVRAARVGDAAALRVPGLPFLRADRFLASYRSRPLDTPQTRAWAERMRALDAESRDIERANLPPEAAAKLVEKFGGRALGETLRHCGNTLMAVLLARPDARQILRARVRAPVHYLRWRRIVGLYYLTSLGVSAGYRKWQRGNLGSFSRPIEDIGITGHLTTYAPLPPQPPPLATAGVAAILKAAARGPLGIPDPDKEDMARLFQTFAPVWQVDTKGDADRIGTPVLTAIDKAKIDTVRPVTYVLASHTRVGDRVLLQLNYMIWFPARPRTGAFDLLGGDFDGLIWRVTLGRDGRPLLYDSVHQCGCYSLFFPARPMRIRPEADGSNGEDGVIAPQQAPTLKPGQRMLIRIAANSHYIRKLAVWSDGAEAGPPPRVYDFVDYNLLRSLKTPAGRHHSLFRADGLLAGSARKERFILWPMGIKSAGAMRQWGTHATAFVGRRYFDAPDLIDRSFILLPER